MKNLKTLVLMQLKDKVDFSYLKSVKKTIFKVVLSILKFAIITAVITFGFFFVSYLRLVSSFAGIPQNFFTLIFTIMYILSIITCSFGLMKTLYMGRDNQLLLTFPAKRTVVFTSKLIVYYIYELIRNINYLVPLFVAYAIINGMPFTFYLWLIVIYFVITAIPVVLGALLSIPFMYATNFVKQHKWLEYTLLVISIGLVVWAIVAIIRAIPSNFDLVATWSTTFWKIRDFLEKFVKIFSPFYYIAVAVIGIRSGITIDFFTFEQVLSIVIMIASIVVVVTLTYFIVRPLYFYMASSPFEYKKVKVTKTYCNNPNNSFLSAVKKDMTLSYRTPEKFYGLLGVMIGLPIAMLLLNKLYAAMDTRLTGTNMTVAFNILIIMLVVLSSNINLAHIYSEEGASSYLLKTSPRPYLQTLTVKLVPNMIAITLAIISSVVIMCEFLGYSFLKGFAIFGMIELFYLAHMLMSAELDIMNPQSNHYQTAGTHHNNPNDIRSTIYAFLISTLIALLVFVLISENSLTVWWKLLGLGLGFMVLRLWLYVNKIKVYFKEK